MREARVIINVPGCWSPKYTKRSEEILNTWGKHIKYPIIFSVSNPSISSEYIRLGNQLHCKVEDTLDFNFTLKRYYFIKWAIKTNQDFDYLYLVGDDTFVYPSKFEALCNEYLSSQENIHYIGEVYPRIIEPTDFTSVRKNFVHPGAYWNFGDNQIINGVDIHNIKSKVPPELWNTNFKPFAAGGSGYLLSRKACNILYNNFHLIREFNENYGYHLGQADDMMVAEVLHKNGIILYHDNRFNHFSFRSVFKPPFIEEPHSIAVCQHRRGGEMQMILDKLGIGHNSFI